MGDVASGRIGSAAWGVGGRGGLDRARLECAWEVQLDAFTSQLRIATELRRLLVHCVRSDGALLDTLRETPALPPTLIMHAFGGSAETAKALLSRLASVAPKSSLASHPARRA